MRVLVTGAAGFIGAATCHRLLERGDEVVGLDDFNDYYDPSLKEARAARLEGLDRFSMVRLDCSDRPAMSSLFSEGGFDRVVHLAAQAGVRHSITDPYAYVDANLSGFLTILEGCRHHDVGHLVYASSSSVYGNNRKLPFSVADPVDHPVSMYAATKKANESMAHAYSNLYGLPTTGLRFFTVYGPWGRPDMALFKFTRAILAGERLQVFNHGNHSRDFTYVDDIVEGVLRTLDRIPEGDPGFDPLDPAAGRSSDPWRVYNIGRGSPVQLTRFIELIEAATGCTADTELLPMQPGDVPDTWADISDLRRDTGYEPSTPVEVGIPRFVEWYRSYYDV